MKVQTHKLVLNSNASQNKLKQKQQQQLQRIDSAGINQLSQMNYTHVIILMNVQAKRRCYSTKKVRIIGNLKIRMNKFIYFFCFRLE